MKITALEAPVPIVKRPVRKVQKHAPPRRLPVRAGFSVSDGTAMPVRFTAHEAVIWYRLHAEPGVIVPYQELLTLAWDSTYRWDDPDEYVRES